MAAKNPNGYGRFRLGGRLVQAHRHAYEIYVGNIPKGLQLHHLCRVRNCVNPAHLVPITHQQNSARAGIDKTGKIKAGVTHCPRGHLLAGENLVKSKPHRECRICKNEQKRERKGLNYGEESN